jgi:hypothetical protein
MLYRSILSDKKPPPGLLGNLVRKLRQHFDAMERARRVSGAEWFIESVYFDARAAAEFSALDELVAATETIADMKADIGHLTTALDAALSRIEALEGASGGPG